MDHLLGGGPNLLYRYEKTVFNTIVNDINDNSGVVPGIDRNIY